MQKNTRFDIEASVRDFIVCLHAHENLAKWIPYKDIEQERNHTNRETNAQDFLGGIDWFHPVHHPGVWRCSRG